MKKIYAFVLIILFNSIELFSDLKSDIRINSDIVEFIENKKKLLTSLSPQKKADTFFKAVEKMKMDGLEILYN